jgi:AcrR family transcriptional regulator
LQLTLFFMSYAEKQLQIIEAAEKLFSIKGFDGASIRDIAEEAGVNLAMISYYFGSKEKLMEAIFEQRMGQVRMRVESMLKDDSLAPFQKMEMLIDENIDRIMQRQQFHKIMVCEQIINKNPIIIKLVNELKKKNAEVIGELVKDGQKKGVFKKDIDVVLLLNTFFGTLTQAMISKDYYRNTVRIEFLSDTDFETYLKKRLSKHLKLVFKAILTYEE